MLNKHYKVIDYSKYNDEYENKQEIREELNENEHNAEEGEEEVNQNMYLENEEEMEEYPQQDKKIVSNTYQNHSLSNIDDKNLNTSDNHNKFKSLEDEEGNNRKYHFTKAMIESSSNKNIPKAKIHKKGPLFRL